MTIPFKPSFSAKRTGPQTQIDPTDLPPPSEPPSDRLLGLQTAVIANFYPLRPWSNIMHGSGPWQSAGRKLADTSAFGDPTESASAVLKTDGFLLPAGPYNLAHIGGVVSLGGSATKNADGTYSFGEGSATISSDGNASNITLTNVSGTKFDEETIAPLRGKTKVFRTLGLANANNGSEITAQQQTEFFSRLAGIGVTIPVSEQTLETYLQYEYNRWEPDWGTRSRSEHTRWSDRNGIPYEEQFDLCRELEVEAIWITCPLFGEAARDTAYAAKLGALCATDWAGRIIFESGNEWWNGGFVFDNMARARAATTEEGAAIIQRETWLAFKQGYLDAGGNAANIQWAVMGWLYNVEFGTKLAAQFTGEKPDLFGPSFYLASGKAQNKWREDAKADPTMPGYTGRTILDDVESGSYPAFASGLKAYADLARAMGADPATYEGNLSIILANLDNVVPLRQAVFEAHDDPYAGELFTKMLDEQIANDYKVICAFAWMHNTVSAKDGIFGMWKWAGAPRPIATSYINYETT
jgi:hypothetical protein